MSKHPIFNDTYSPTSETYIDRIVLLCRIGVAAGASEANISIGEPEFTKLLEVIAEQAERAIELYDSFYEVSTHGDAQMVHLLAKLPASGREEVFAMIRNLAGKAAA